jgi:radical SAM superfamily enzyme YgiQ (UPF0313 family)
VKITLVSPATDISRRRKGARPRGTPFFHYYKLGLATMAGATPPEFQVEAIDEFVDWWDPTTHQTDAVAISTLTALAPRAYTIAKAFRARGIPVILGGMHPTFMPEEAAEHADAIVFGQGEVVWEQLCRDLAAGELKPIYDPGECDSWIAVPSARRDIFTNRAYAPLDILQFSRGCTHRCRFCSVNAFFKCRYHRREIDEVKAEFPTLKRKHLMVADDNLYADRDYCLKVFEALAPLKKYTGVQATMDMALDDEVMDAAKEANVSAVFVGFESVVGDSLAESAKRHNTIDRYAEAIDAFHRRGIFVETGLMFGFDHDEPDVFEKTLAAMDKINVDVAQVAVVTPMPGTGLFDIMNAEGRITDRNWEHYDCNHLVFEPKLMTSQQLNDGVTWFREQFYSRRAIFRRSVRNKRHFDFITWATQTALNLGFRKNHRLGLDYPP